MFRIIGACAETSALCDLECFNLLPVLLSWLPKLKQNQ